MLKKLYAYFVNLIAGNEVSEGKVDVAQQALTEISMIRDKKIISLKECLYIANLDVLEDATEEEKLIADACKTIWLEYGKYLKEDELK